MLPPLSSARFPVPAQKSPVRFRAGIPSWLGKSCLLAGLLSLWVCNPLPAQPAPADVWIYEQSTGKLHFKGKVVAQGYAGRGKGLNNPDAEKERNVGPVPRGEYTIGEAFKHPTIGPLVMRLTPIGHTAHGRSGFLIHGDNRKMDRSASRGCIILPPAVRTQIAESPVKRLRVVR